MIMCCVRGNAVNPGGKGGFVPEAVQRAADFQENGLGKIMGVVRAC